MNRTDFGRRCALDTWIGIVCLQNERRVAPQIWFIVHMIIMSKRPVSYLLVMPLNRTSKGHGRAVVKRDELFFGWK